VAQRGKVQQPVRNLTAKIGEKKRSNPKSAGNGRKELKGHDVPQPGKKNTQEMESWGEVGGKKECPKAK